MSEQQIEANRLLVNRFYHELWNEHQFEIAEEIMTEDVTFHGALGKETKGIVGVQKNSGDSQWSYQPFCKVTQSGFIVPWQ